MDFTGLDRITQAINEKRHAFIQAGVISDWTHRIAEGIDAPCEALFEGETQTANMGILMVVGDRQRVVLERYHASRRRSTASASPVRRRTSSLYSRSGRRSF